MMQYRNKIVRYLVMILLCMSLLPLHGIAQIFIETKTVSGTITRIRDNAVELDATGTFYFPLNKNWTMKFKAGDVITLRYYVDNSNEPTRMYVESAAGWNTLSPTKAPRSKKVIR